MNSSEILENILKIIGRDDVLIEEFSEALGLEPGELVDFINKVTFVIIKKAN